MGQNNKMVHWPDKRPETAELKWLLRDKAFSRSLEAVQTESFCSFLPYPVRFKPIAVLVVHPGTNKTAHLWMDGPMDNNSVKNCATVAHMRQKPSNTALRGSSQLA